MTTTSARLAMPVETLMTRRVVLVLEDIPVSEVRAIAARYDFNGFPVVTPEGRLVGIITKGDLLRVALAGAADPGVWRQPVSRWMAHGVLALRPMDSLETALTHLVEAGLRSLPVIEAGGRVVGMVSRGDLMSAIEPEGTT